MTARLDLPRLLKITTAPFLISMIASCVEPSKTIQVIEPPAPPVPELSAEPISVISTLRRSVISLAFREDEKVVYTGDSLATVRAWDISSELPVGSVFLWANNVTISGNGNRAVSGARNLVKIAELPAGNISHTFRTGIGEFIRKIYLSPDGSEGIAMLSSGDVTRLNLDAGQVTPSSLPAVSIGWASDSSSFSSSGKHFLLTSSKLPLANVIDTKLGKVVRTISIGSKGVRASVWSPDSKLIAVVGADNTVNIWSVQSGHSLERFRLTQSKLVNRMIFSPDGNYLIFGGNDGSVTFWDVRQNAFFGSFAAHDGWVEALAASKNGKFLATTGPDKILKIWNLGEILGQPKRNSS